MSPPSQTNSALDELLNLTSEPYHNEVLIQDAEWSSDGSLLQLRLEVRPWDGAPQAWAIECADLADFDLLPGAFTGLSITADHPVLWSFLDPRVELFFRGRTGSTHHVIGRLYDVHASLVEGWIRFERFLNQDLALAALFEGGQGVLADGPERLLAAYTQVLDAEGLSTSLVNRRAPHRKVGQRILDVSPTIRALLLGESYVVAEHFTARRLETASSP